MAPDHPTDWKSIAQQVSTETDPQKLSTLIHRLTKALDEQALAKSQRVKPDNA